MLNYWTKPAHLGARPPDWIAVALFWGAACFWSALASNINAIRLPATIGGFKIDDSILVGLGPGIGALVAAITRPQPTYRPTFLGRRAVWTLIAMTAPIVTLAVWGLGRATSFNGNVAGAVFAATVVLYCIGEELGWRGYLFAQFAGLPLWQSALATAILWYGWHWTFLADTLLDPKVGPFFAAAVLLASFGLATAVMRTQAIGIAVAWHAAAKAMGAPAQIMAMLATIAMANFMAGRSAKAINQPPGS